jgi:hypothetical protein
MVVASAVWVGFDCNATKRDFGTGVLHEASGT